MVATFLAPPAGGARAGDAVSAAAGPAVASLVAAACPTDPATPKRQLRGMWIATVANIDWPSRAGLPVATQQAEYRAWLDLAQRRNMNAVFVQVRPDADAFWPSPHEPWSKRLTGTQGADPGYDPLAFMVAEAHARDIEFHAWFNPYRVAGHDEPTQLVATHPARVHPDWVFAYRGQTYYNPGIPAVREFVEIAMMDAVTRYDIDGVHFDDYFYPYPSSAPIPDQRTFAQYGRGFTDIRDWRRDNVNLMVREMNQRIKAAKPWVAFGISPFGIWRNASTDPLGSPTAGLQSYDAIYADTRRWVKERWIDYVVPQLYWHIGFDVADYAKLLSWWADLVAGTGVSLYIGQATYRVGVSTANPAWHDPAELTRHLSLNRTRPEVAGDIQFSAKSVRADTLGAVSRLTADHYRRPALSPRQRLIRPAPEALSEPSVNSIARTGRGVDLAWKRGDGGEPTAYAIYRVDGSGPFDPCDLAGGANLLGTVRAGGSVRAGGTGGSFTDTTAIAGATYTYHVTALDRLDNEGAPSVGAVTRV